MKKKDRKKLTELVEDLSIEIKNAKIHLRETRATLEFVIEHGKDEVVIDMIREGYMDYRYVFRCIYKCKLKTYHTGILADSVINYKELKILKNGNYEIIFKHRDFYYKVDKKSGDCMNIPEPLFVSQEKEEEK